MVSIRQLLTVYGIREDIYFLQNDPKAKEAALTLRDAVLRLRRDGAFVAGS